jgi:DNA ligase D-like protein (predicted polymerase)
MPRSKQEAEVREGISFSSLDEELFDGARATKRDFVDYLDAMSDRIVPALAGRLLSVIRVRPGQEKFMQKNLPKYAPDWIERVTLWAEASKRDVTYAVCNDRRTLLWFANQRAVEYHPGLMKAGEWTTQTHLILDIDPPEGGAFDTAVRAAHLVREALTELNLAGAVKTSGAKGVHIFVPVAETAVEDAAAATRAIAARAERLDPDIATTAFIKEDRGGKVFLDSTRAGGATVVAPYSPRARADVPISFPMPWEELDRATPGDFTIHSVPELLGGRDPWAELMPAPQRLSDELLAEGHAIPIARVQAMHEGKRRARAARKG